MTHRLAAPFVLLLGTVGLAVHAAAPSATDPLQAPECTQAIAALQEQEAAAASAPAAASGARAPDPKLTAARKRAARLCLATRPDVPAPAGRFAQPPLAVPPLATVRPPPAPASSGAALPPRSPTPRPLVSITSCDAAGCWTSEGKRLNRVGPTLWGRHGACTVQGTVVICP